MTEWVRSYGPCALIAGASEGIGAAFARVLAEAGFELILIARRQGPLDALKAELGARHSTSIETIAMDLASPELEARLEELARTREIGLVVYNAAFSVVAPFLGTSLADKARMIDVNVKGPLTAAHVFGKFMAERGRGGIVLLSSLTAFWGSPWVATYGATKAFNLSLGEAIAHELGERGVDVVVSCAGATRTPGFVDLVEGSKKPPASMEPEAVARETLRALPRRGAFVPGSGNRFAQWFLSRVLPRRTAIRIMAGHTRGLLEHQAGRR